MTQKTLKIQKTQRTQKTVSTQKAQIIERIQETPRTPKTQKKSNYVSCIAIADSGLQTEPRGQYTEAFFFNRNKYKVQGG